MEIITVQVLLYQTAIADVDRLIAQIASLDPMEGFRIELLIGDCSSERVVDSERINSYSADLASSNIELDYKFFGENLGFAAGHNRLALAKNSDWYCFLNPDTLFLSNLIRNLINGISDDVAIVEARQIPFEHPKEIDAKTFEVGWASMCCANVRGSIFRQLGGFDEAFFMYCEDVDLSWRIRAAGWRCVMAPSAVIYHSKRYGRGGPEPSDTERLYGAVGQLLLYRKYGARRLETQTARAIGVDNVLAQRIQKEFRERSALLMPLRAGDKACSDFRADGTFGGRRWSYTHG